MLGHSDAVEALITLCLHPCGSRSVLLSTLNRTFLIDSPDWSYKWRVPQLICCVSPWRESLCSQVSSGVLLLSDTAELSFSCRNPVIIKSMLCLKLRWAGECSRPRWRNRTQPPAPWQTHSQVWSCHRCLLLLFMLGRIYMSSRIKKQTKWKSRFCSWTWSCRHVRHGFLFVVWPLRNATWSLRPCATTVFAGRDDGEHEANTSCHSWFQPRMLHGLLI